MLGVGQEARRSVAPDRRRWSLERGSAPARSRQLAGLSSTRCRRFPSPSKHQHPNAPTGLPLAEIVLLPELAAWARQPGPRSPQTAPTSTHLTCVNSAVTRSPLGRTTQPCASRVARLAHGLANSEPMNECVLGGGKPPRRAPKGAPPRHPRTEHAAVRSGTERVQHIGCAELAVQIMRRGPDHAARTERSGPSRQIKVSSRVQSSRWWMGTGPPGFPLATGPGTAAS